jgi:predicted PurR-regulated permease PerM
VTALWILAVLGVVFFLRSARALLIPIALAVLISYALEPVVAWLERHRVHRMLGSGVVLLLLLGGIAAGAYAVRDDARQLVEAAPKAAERARQLVTSQLGAGGEALGKGGQTPSAPSSRGGADAEQAVGSSGQMPGSLVQQAVSAILSGTGHAVVIFFLVFFVLVYGHRVKDRFVEVSGATPEKRHTTATIIKEINAQIQRYLLVLLLTAAIVGLSTWLVLAWMGTQQAAMWGMLAGIFNSIPYFGPVIVSGGLFVVGIVQGGGVSQALQMSGAAIVITSLEGWLLTPPLMGKAEKMSALAVFLGLLLWTWIWGGWGTVLAVPMLVIIKSFADHIDRLKPVGRLMAP